MKEKRMKQSLFILFLLTSTVLFGQEQVLYSIDFTKQKDGDARQWLKSQGFEYFLDMKDFSVNFSNKRLVIETENSEAGLLGINLPEEKFLQNVGRVVIEWGVDKFPHGADWANNNNRLALGAIFVLGTETFSSGSLLFGKSAPYFLAPFIGEKEEVGKVYLGQLYQEAGRYYCVTNKSGTSIKTDFNINQKFQQEFKKKTPPLTAFGVQMNTTDTQGGAKAFVKKITFYSAN